MPNVPFVFPEYGMTNASNFRWGIPPASNPKGCKKGGIYLQELAGELFMIRLLHGLLGFFICTYIYIHITLLSWLL